MRHVTRQGDHVLAHRSSVIAGLVGFGRHLIGAVRHGTCGGCGFGHVARNFRRRCILLLGCGADVGDFFVQHLDRGLGLAAGDDRRGAWRAPERFGSALRPAMRGCVSAGSTAS
jgi:hypothetical protein